MDLASGQGLLLLDNQYSYMYMSQFMPTVSYVACTHLISAAACKIRQLNLGSATSSFLQQVPNLG